MSKVFVDMSFSEADIGYTVFGIGRGGQRELVGRHYPWFGVYVPRERVDSAAEKLKKLPHVVEVVKVEDFYPVIDKYPFRLVPDPTKAVLRVAVERKDYVPNLAKAATRLLGPETRAGVYNIVYDVRASFDLGLRFFFDAPPLLFIPNKYLKELAVDVITKNRDIRVMSFDIEVATEPGRFPLPGDPIISIQYGIVRLDDPNFADPSWPKDNIVTLVADTKDESHDLVEEFINVVRKERPDIIVGYNSAHFDVRYMAPFMPEHARFRNLSHLAMPGLEFPHIDLMQARDRMGSSLGVRSQRARSLPDVIREVVKGTPFEWVLTSKYMEAEERLDHTKLVQEWEAKTDLFYNYITADAYLTLILAYLWMPTIILLSATTHIPPTVLTRLNIGQTAEYTLIRWYEWLGFEPVVVERTAEIKKVKNTYALEKLTNLAKIFGKGKVYVATYGVFKGIAEGDFSQLYPTLMANDALDPTAVRVLEVATLVGRRERKRYSDPVKDMKVAKKAFPVVLGRPPITKEGKVKKNADYMEPTVYYLVVPTYGPASFLVYKMYTMRKITKGLKKRAEKEGRPELKAPDQAVKIMNNCYLPGTLVMTPSGPKKIEELLPSDRVYALDLKTGSVTVTTVEKTWEYDYDGDMYILETNAATLVATPEQNIVVADQEGRPTLKPISRFEGRTVELPRVRPQAGGKQSEEDLTPLLKYGDPAKYEVTRIESEKAARIAWTCCGKPTKMIRQCDEHICTLLTPDPADLVSVTALYFLYGRAYRVGGIDKVFIDLSNFGSYLAKAEVYRLVTSITNGAYLADGGIIITSEPLVRYLKDEVGVESKRVPGWISEGSVEVRKEFLRALKTWGGFGEWIVVRDWGDAMEVAKLAITLGYSVRYEKHWRGWGVKLVTSPVGKVRRVSYKGKVYDVSTPYGTIIAGTSHGFIPTGQSLYGSFSKRRGFINQVLAAYIFWKTLSLLYDLIGYIEAELGLKVLYGDTDSVFLKVSEKAKEAEERFKSEILPVLNTYVRQKYGKEFNIDFEDAFDYCLYPKQKKSGKASKKTYICGDYSEDGDPIVRVFKGEFFKTTAPLGIKERLSDFYREVLKRRPTTPEGVMAIMKEFLKGAIPVRYFVKKIVDTFQAEARQTDTAMYIVKLKNLNKPFHYAALHLAYAYNLPGVEVESDDGTGNVSFTVDPNRVLSTGDIVVYYLPTNDPRHFYVYIDYDAEKNEVIYHEVKVKEVRILSEKENNMIRHTGYRVSEKYRVIKAKPEDVLELAVHSMRKYIVDDIMEKLVPAIVKGYGGPLSKYMMRG